MPLAITDEASLLALLSTRNRPRVVRRGAADPQRSSAQQPPGASSGRPLRAYWYGLQRVGIDQALLALNAEDPAAGRLGTSTIPRSGRPSSDRYGTASPHLVAAWLIAIADAHSAASLILEARSSEGACHVGRVRDPRVDRALGQRGARRRHGRRGRRSCRRHRHVRRRHPRMGPRHRRLSRDVATLFEWQRQGATFEIVSLEVTAGADVAFAHALLRCGTDEEFRKDPDNRLG